MINYKYADLFYRDNMDKQAKIEYSGGVMTNTELFQNSEELTESLCSEKELRFGSCEAGSFKFKVANIVKSMTGEWITFRIVIDHHEETPLMIGRYKVSSDKETADRRYREIVAYDAMYDILNADMAVWYNAVLPDDNSTVTLRQFRTSFIRHFGLEEVLPPGGLVNDGMTVQRTIQPEQISGKDIITAICEINGCFGHVGRDGKFHYIYLPQAIEGLYPANDLYPDHAPEWMVQAKTGHLYPQDPQSTRLGTGRYIKCQYEDYITKRIARLQIRQKENDIGIIWPDENGIDSDNCYIIEDNFLVYGKSHDELSGIARNIFSKITDIVYRPFDAVCVGNPCLEVGDPVRFPTKYAIVESYILKRTLKGIQALRDSYKADGTEKYSEKLNGLQKSIVQLKGKTNTLERTIDETKLEMKDMGEELSVSISATARELRVELEDVSKGLSNTISATAGEIRGELQNTKDGLETTISATAAGIMADVSRTYETKSDASIEYTSICSSIEVESGRISSEIERATRAEMNLAGEITNTATTLSSKIEQTESSIKTEVSESYQTKTGAQEQYSNLQSSIIQNANNIALKVSKTDYNGSHIASLINQSPDTITIEANHLNLNGAVTANKRFYINPDGSFNASYGMIGRFYVNGEFLEANDATEDIGFQPTHSLILYPPVKPFDPESLAIQVRHHIKGFTEYKYPFSLTYGGHLVSEDATVVSKGGDYSVAIDGGKIQFFLGTEEKNRRYIGSIESWAFDSTHSGIKIMNSADYQLGGTALFAGSDDGIKYLMNDGLSPNGITERHIFWDSVRVMGTLYNSSGVAITSDKRLKNSIGYLDPEECLSFINCLSPKRFKYKGGESGRYHHGLIAGEVKEAMGGEDWGVYVKCTNDFGTEGIRYEELIPDLIGAVQALSSKINNI